MTLSSSGTGDRQATTDSEPADSPAFPSFNWKTAERLIKFGTGGLAIVYAFGFMVVLTAHARYGIVLFDLFRARVLAAGFLITFFVLLPVLTGMKFQKAFLEKTPKLNSALGYLIIGIFYLWVVVFISAYFYPLFPDHSRVVFHVSSNAAWWMLTMFSVSLLFIQFPKDKPWTTLLLLALVWGVLNFCIYVLLNSTLLIVSLWLLVFAAAPVMVSNLIARQKADQRQSGWYFSVAFYVVVVVVSFTHFIYFRVKPSWGGGLPVRITISLTKPIPFSNSGSVQAFLIDETDKGYYLVHNEEDHKASFIPREMVTSIDFEEVR